MDDVGEVRVALSFNGTSARVRVADSASLGLTSAVTLEAWVYPAASQSGWRAVVQKADRLVSVACE